MRIATLLAAVMVALAFGGSASTSPPTQVQLTYRTGVSNGVDSDADFAADVDRILSDPRSWGGLHRVGNGVQPDVWISLLNEAMFREVCKVAAGTATNGGCMYPGYLYINGAYNSSGRQAFGVDLDGYKTFIINHEVGHFLGHGHETCPGPGKLASVMSASAADLTLCTVNGWPYPKGR